MERRIEERTLIYVNLSLLHLKSLMCEMHPLSLLSWLKKKSLHFAPLVMCIILKIVFPLKKNEEGFRKQMKNEMSHRLKSADDSCGYDLLASFESIFVGKPAEVRLC